MADMTPPIARIICQATNTMRLPTAESEINTTEAVGDISTAARDEDEAGGQPEQSITVTTSTKSSSLSQQLGRRASPRKFMFYPKLPAEIKSHIIQYAMTPRILKLGLKTTAKAGTIPYKLSGGPVPALLLVNKATRNEAQRKYKKVGKSGWRSLPEAYMYFNPQIDTLLITAWVTQGCSYLPTNLPFRLLEAFDGIETANYVRYVAFDHRSIFLVRIVNDALRDRFHELLLHHPNMQHIDMVYDNSTRTSGAHGPEDFVFTEAAGVAHSSCFCNAQVDTIKNRDTALFAEYLDHFEAERGLEGNKGKQVERFWEDNPAWKRPTVDGVSIIQKPGLRKQAGKGKKREGAQPLMDLDWLYATAPSIGSIAP